MKQFDACVCILKNDGQAQSSTVARQAGVTLQAACMALMRAMRNNRVRRQRLYISGVGIRSIYELTEKGVAWLTYYRSRGAAAAAAKLAEAQETEAEIRRQEKAKLADEMKAWREEQASEVRQLMAEMKAEKEVERKRMEACLNCKKDPKICEGCEFARIVAE